MTTIDSLPPDQRAVLQLVLKRGRSYDDIAAALSIDRASVRQRALDALDSLSPAVGAPMPAERSLITDYLLGQLPAGVADQVYGMLATSPSDRDWADAVATELDTFFDGSLPAIPAASEVQVDIDAEPRSTSSASSTLPLEDEFESELEDFEYAPEGETPARWSAPPSVESESWKSSRRVRPPASRRGGRIVLAFFGLIVIAAIVVVVFVSGGGSNTKNKLASANTKSTTTAATTSTKTTANKPDILAQLNLNAPKGTGRARGVADVVVEEGVTGLVIYATHVPANTKKNAYAVWLSTAAGKSKFVGFVPKLVGKDGKLSTEGKLPADAKKYTRLLITLETQAKPTSPGATVLSAPFRETAS